MDLSTAVFTRIHLAPATRRLAGRSEEHTSELQSQSNLVCRLLLEKKKRLETNNLFNNLIQVKKSSAFSSGKCRPTQETTINIIARRTGKDVNSHTVLDGIITTIMATIQRINIIGSREGSRNFFLIKGNPPGYTFLPYINRYH